MPLGSAVNSIGVTAALTIAALYAGPATAQQDDGCPAPKVEVRNRVSGERYRPPGGLDFEPGSPGEEMLAGVHEAALNELIAANRGEVRFFEAFGAESPDVDFVLTADGVTTGDPVAPGGWLLTSTLELVDARGRAVRPRASVDYTAADLESGRGDIVDRVADPFRPMLRLIREHQVRIREREKGAIYAAARVRPEQAEVEQEEELTLTLELYDCGPGGRVPLADREVRLEHSGVGRLDRATVTTDADGAAEFVFVSREPGTAEIFAIWRYENTEGRALTADGGLASIRVGPGLALNATLGPAYRPDDRSRTWYLGGVYVLAEGEVDRYFPDGGAPAAEEYTPSGCAAGVKWRRSELTVPRYGGVVWEDGAALGPQRSRARIEARQDKSTAAEVRVLVSSNAETQDGWDEEEWSETSAFVAFDLLVEVRNPEERDYFLVVGLPVLRIDADGGIEYEAFVRANDGVGCEKGDVDAPGTLVGSSYDYLSQGARRHREGRSGESWRIRVAGDPRAQLAFRVFVRSATWSDTQHAPHSGTGEIELALRFETIPVSPEER